jgi:hypothetical protein
MPMSMVVTMLKCCCMSSEHSSRYDKRTCLSHMLGRLLNVVPSALETAIGLGSKGEKGLGVHPRL